MQQFPAGSADGKVLLQAIAKAQQAMGEASSKVAVPAGPKLQVRVDLSSQLKSKVSPDEIVFVYAQASKGPKMPLAIVRKKVKDLPLTVTLDKSMSMAPRFNLGSFPNVVVFARISKSGQAMPTAGDLEGHSQVIKVSGAKPVSVHIDSVIK